MLSKYTRGWEKTWVSCAAAVFNYYKQICFGYRIPGGIKYASSWISPVLHGNQRLIIYLCKHKDERTRRMYNFSVQKLRWIYIYICVALIAFPRQHFHSIIYVRVYSAVVLYAYIGGCWDWCDANECSCLYRQAIILHVKFGSSSCGGCFSWMLEMYCWKKMKRNF
jgi:hypothetical protein